jgi:phage-related holin
VIIAIAFLIPSVFMEIGKVINVNLSVTRFLGWMTLAMLLVNEVRSIIENLVCLNIQVPEVLIKGLAITDKILQDTQK